MASADLLTADIPWYRTVSKEQWRAFFATFFGWVIDAFDYNMLAFVLIDIQKSFTVDRTLAGALATVTLVMRLAGGVIAGSAADKWGRKLPMMISILWFSLFAFLSGFSTSYAMLFAFRALFGIGMGGEWTSGMPLLLEHWPARLRGIASGLLLGGWYWGYLLAATAFHFLYPLFQGVPDVGWRAMFWLAILPAFLTLWMRTGVRESPVWLARQRRLQEAKNAGNPIVEPRISLVRIFQRDLFWTTIHTTALIGAFMCSFYSISQWYPTFLREGGRSTLPFMIAFNVGAIAGTAIWGRLSETKLGRRGAVTITALVGAAVSSAVPPCRHSGSVNDRSAGDGSLRLRHLGDGSGLCDRTVSHGHSGRRAGLLLSRGCCDRRRDADPDRQASGSAGWMLRMR